MPVSRDAVTVLFRVYIESDGKGLSLPVTILSCMPGHYPKHPPFSYASKSNNGYRSPCAAEESFSCQQYSVSQQSCSPTRQ